MEEVSTSDVRDHFSEIVNKVAFGKERFIFNRRGKGLVAMIPIEDLRWLEMLEDQRDLEEARAGVKAAKKEGTKPWKQIKKELGM